MECPEGEGDGKGWCDGSGKTWFVGASKRGLGKGTGKGKNKGKHALVKPFESSSAAAAQTALAVVAPSSATGRVPADAVLPVTAPDFGHSPDSGQSLPTRVSWWHPTSVLSVLLVLLSMGAFALHFALQATNWLDTLASATCDAKFTFGTCMTRRSWMGVTPAVETMVWILCIGGIIWCSWILARVTCLWRRALRKELEETGLVASQSKTRKLLQRASKSFHVDISALHAFEGGLGRVASRDLVDNRGHRGCYRCGQGVSICAAVFGWADYFAGVHSPQYFRLQFVSEVMEGERSGVGGGYFGGLWRGACFGGVCGAHVGGGAGAGTAAVGYFPVRFKVLTASAPPSPIIRGPPASLSFAPGSAPSSLMLLAGLFQAVAVVEYSRTGVS
jgi:hypothetical protein